MLGTMTEHTKKQRHADLTASKPGDFLPRLRPLFSFGLTNPRLRKAPRIWRSWAFLGLLLTVPFFAGCGLDEIPVSLSLSVSPSQVTGGNPAEGKVIVSNAGSTTTVHLRSDNPSVASVPASVLVTGSGTFTVTTSPVTQPTQVTIFAEISNGATTVFAMAVVTVNPAGVASVTLNPSVVMGGISSTGTVTLAGPAPAGGAVVTLSSSNTSAATVPVNVTVPAGATTAMFKVTAIPGTTQATSTITATYNGSANAILTVNPPAPTLTAVSPNRFYTGQSYMVTLTGTNFTPNATVNAGTDVKVTIISVSPDGLQLTCTFDLANAKTGSHSAKVTTPSGSTNTVPFFVDAPPTLTGISPASGVQGATGLVLTVTGTNFAPGATVTFAGTGITVTSGGISADQTTITVTVDIAPDATLGARDVIVNTNGITLGTSGQVKFTVNPASTGPNVAVSLVTPANTTPNTDNSVVIKMSNTGSASTTSTEKATLTTSPNVSPTHLAGKGLTCDLPTLTCTTNNPIPAGSTLAAVLTYQALRPTGPGTTAMFTANVTGSGVPPVSTSATSPILTCQPGSASLCGPYLLYVNGPAESVLASFTADGADHLMPGGVLDANSTIGAPMVDVAINPAAPTGYTFESPTGFTFGNLTLGTATRVFNFKIVLNQAGSGDVIEFEPNGTVGGSGFLFHQASAFDAATINGPYGLSVLGGPGGASSGVHAAMIGAIAANGTCGFSAAGPTATINDGGIVSRTVNFSGALHPAGNCAVDPMTGRGSGTFTNLIGTPVPAFSTENFALFPIDYNDAGTVADMVMLTTDQTSATQPLLSGLIISQIAAPFNTNAALDCGVSLNVGCAFASAGVTGGNSLTGSSHMLLGSAGLFTQSNTAGQLTLMRDENKGGVITSGKVTGSYSYLSDGTGSIVLQTGETVDIVLIGIDEGFTLSEGTSVATGSFFPQAPGPDPFSGALSPLSFLGGQRVPGASLANVSASTTIAAATVTAATPTPSNTGKFSGNIRFWNSATHQNSAVLTGDYVKDPATGRVTVTNMSIPGATSAVCYSLDLNRFVLMGTTNGDTNGVLLFFQLF